MTVIYPSRAHGVLPMLSTPPALHACQLQAAHRPVGAGPEHWRRPALENLQSKTWKWRTADHFKDVRMEDGRKGI